MYIGKRKGVDSDRNLLRNSDRFDTMIEVAMVQRYSEFCNGVVIEIIFKELSDQ